MADLTGPLSARDGRGQILLVAAFALAVIFVALALVVNSAIFTENLATRGEVSGTADALDQRHEVVQSVGTAIGYVNVHNHSNLGVIEDNIENISSQVNRQEIAVGRSVDVSYVSSYTPGDRIAQRNDSNRHFTSNSDDPDWEPATSVSSARNIELNVTDIGILNPNLGGSFAIVANGTSNNWTMDVWESTVGSEVSIRVETGNGDEAECVRTVSGHVSIDVTGGTFAGEPCHALTKLSDGTEMAFGTGVTSDYDIEFENGDEIVGNYSMIVSDGDANTTNLDPPPSNGPFYTPAIYDVTVEYVFETPELLYETEIEIAPGKP